MKISVPGILLASGSADVKGSGNDRHDMGLIYFEQGSLAAGVFTTNKMAAAPVRLCRERIPSDSIRAVLVNSGNANAMTGEQGYGDALEICREVSDLLTIPEESVLFCSTGVIGERLPVERMKKVLPGLVQNLTADGAGAFSGAILTTDTRAKTSSRDIELSGGSARVLGIAKGAGMIAPEMATMLAFIITDAKVLSGALQEILSRACDESFNSITVDGDRSTNDTVLLISSGAGPETVIDSDVAIFADAVAGVCGDLASQIVSDGEGTTRVVCVKVNGAPDDSQARLAARAVAESLLVKTAIAAADPNWGRIAAAVGYSGADVSPESLSLSIGEVKVLRNGALTELYDEAAAAKQMRSDKYTVYITVGVGPGSASILTTDLTEEYVRINCDYRS